MHVSSIVCLDSSTKNMGCQIMSAMLTFFLATGIVLGHPNWDPNSSSVSKWLLANKIPADQLITDLQSIELENHPAANKDNLNLDDLQSPSCQLVQIVHLLHQTGCQPKAISSFACAGSCSSYVQVSKNFSSSC